MCLAAALGSTTACSQRDPAPAGGGARESARGTTAAGTAIGEWAPELGSMLVVPSDTENLALVLYPLVTDTRTLAAARLALLAPGGDTVRAQTGLAGSDSMQCGEAPVVRLTPSAPLTWSIGLQSADAVPLRTDSMETLSAADSVFYTTDMSRLASAVAATQSSRFAGLPFVVTTVRRMRRDGLETVAAQLVRRVNQEADPLEERTLIIAERGVGLHSASFMMVHSERSEGSEDTAEHFEILSAMRTPRTTLLIVARDQVSGTTYEVLERSAAGRWRMRWSRSIAC